MSKECDKPRNLDTVTCRNCEESKLSYTCFSKVISLTHIKAGHYSRDCTKKKDWSKVKCNNCGESKFYVQQYSRKT